MLLTKADEGLGAGWSSGRCATWHMTQTLEGQSVLTLPGLLLELVSPHCENCIVAFAASSTFTVQKKMKASNLTCWLAGSLAVLFVGPAGHTRHLNQSILWEGLLILNYSDIIFLKSTVVCQDHVSVGIGVLAFQIAIEIWQLWGLWHSIFDGFEYVETVTLSNTLKKPVKHR